MNGTGLKYLLCGVALAAGTITVAGAATSKHGMSGRTSGRTISGRTVRLQRWPGQRVVLVLPVSLGANWNADPGLGRALVDDAQSRLETALRATNKLSVFQLHRFDPVLVRAVQEKKLTQQELVDASNPLSTVPWLTRARTVMGRLTAEGAFFDQPPLIGDFSIEELRTGGDERRPSVQVQVSGRFYELGAESPQTLVATSDAVRVTKDPFDAILEAARNAFAHVASAFTQPIDAYTLPFGGAPVPGVGPANAPVTLIPAWSPPSGPTPVPPTLPDGSPLPGSVPIAGSSTRNQVAPPNPGPPATTVGPPNTTTLPTTTAPTAPALPAPNPPVIPPPANPGPAATTIGPPTTTPLPTTPAPTAPALPGPDANQTPAVGTGAAPAPAPTPAK